MAEGTRLKEICENIRALEERMQTFFTDCHNHIENRLQQVSEEYNIKLGVFARQLDEIQIKERQRYEALQIEAARRHEIMMQEQNRRHEQLLKLILRQPSVSQPTPSFTANNNPSTIKNGRTNNSESPSCSSTAVAAEARGKGILLTPYQQLDRMGDIQNKTPFHLPYPKLEFPTFNGEEPKKWSSKSEQYFKIYQISVI